MVQNLACDFRRTDRCQDAEPPQSWQAKTSAANTRFMSSDHRIVPRMAFRSTRSVWLAAAWRVRTAGRWAGCGDVSGLGRYYRCCGVIGNDERSWMSGRIVVENAQGLTSPVVGRCGSIVRNPITCSEPRSGCTVRKFSRTVGQNHRRVVKFTV
jgi:hypothetical protein